RLAHVRGALDPGAQLEWTLGHTSSLHGDRVLNLTIAEHACALYQVQHVVLHVLADVAPLGSERGDPILHVYIDRQVHADLHTFPHHFTLAGSPCARPPARFASAFLTGSAPPSGLPICVFFGKLVAVYAVGRSGPPARRSTPLDHVPGVLLGPPSLVHTGLRR